MPYAELARLCASLRLRDKGAVPPPRRAARSQETLRGSRAGTRKTLVERLQRWHKGTLQPGEPPCVDEQIVTGAPRGQDSTMTPTSSLPVSDAPLRSRASRC
jgi:hypothetical protein